MEKVTNEVTSATWKVFFVVAIGVFMSTMDSSMVNIALPSIMVEFKSPLKSTQWVVLIYLLTITASLLLWGYCSDRFGRKRIYSWGLTVFALGSLACSLAHSLTWLVFARFWQAIGAAMMMSTGPAIIKEVFPASQIGRGLGMIGVSVSLGLMIGPSVSGFLLEFFEWRAIFLINVPIGLGVAFIAKRLLPEKNQVHVVDEINWPSVFTWLALLATISYTLTYASSPTWSREILGVLVGLVVLLLMLFILLEYRTRRPFLPIHLIKNRFFYIAILCALFSFMVLFSVLILMPFFLDRVRGLRISSIGLVMMSLPLTVLFVAPLAGLLSDHVPAKIISTLGLILSTLSMFWFSNMTETLPISGIVYRLVLLGCGQGMFLAPNSASILHRVSRQDSGKAASLLATARNMGMLLGICQSTLVFSFFFSQLTGNLDMKDFSIEHSAAFMTALNKVFQASAFIGILGVFLSWFRDGGTKNE